MGRASAATDLAGLPLWELRAVGASASGTGAPTMGPDGAAPCEPLTDNPLWESGANGLVDGPGAYLGGAPLWEPRPSWPCVGGALLWEQGTKTPTTTMELGDVPLWEPLTNGRPGVGVTVLEGAPLWEPGVGVPTGELELLLDGITLPVVEEGGPDASAVPGTSASGGLSLASVGRLAVRTYLGARRAAGDPRLTGVLRAAPSVASFIARSRARTRKLPSTTPWCRFGPPPSWRCRRISTRCSSPSFATPSCCPRRATAPRRRPTSNECGHCSPLRAGWSGRRSTTMTRPRPTTSRRGRSTAAAWVTNASRSRAGGNRTRWSPAGLAGWRTRPTRPCTPGCLARPGSSSPIVARVCAWPRDGQQPGHGPPGVSRLTAGASGHQRRGPRPPAARSSCDGPGPGRGPHEHRHGRQHARRGPGRLGRAAHHPVAAPGAGCRAGGRDRVLPRRPRGFDRGRPRGRPGMRDRRHPRRRPSPPRPAAQSARHRPSGRHQRCARPCCRRRAPGGLPAGDGLQGPASSAASSSPASPTACRPSVMPGGCGCTGIGPHSRAIPAGTSGSSGPRP